MTSSGRMGLPLMFGTSLTLIAASLAAEESTRCRERVELFVEPSRESPVIGTVPAGTPLRVIAREGEWLRVADPASGYASFVSRAGCEPVSEVAARTVRGPVPKPAATTAPSALARGEAQHRKSETSGAAVGGGCGYQMAGCGAALHLYLQGRSPLKLALYGGAGYFPGSLGKSESDLGLNGVAGYALGVMLLLGGEHRFVVDGSYGLAAHEAGQSRSWDSYGQRSYSSYDKVVYGATAAIGYEYMDDDGLLARATAGVTRFDEPLLFDGSKSTWTANLAIGMRF
jgi:hypothetical protein